MTDGAALAEKIYEQVKKLPEDSQLEVIRFIKSLQLRADKVPTAEAEHLDTSQARALRGILKGYDFSPEFIAEARRAMWASFGTADK